jgi:hypothetical protein
MALNLEEIASKLDLTVAAVEGQERPLSRKLKAAFQEHLAGLRPEDLSADVHDMLFVDFQQILDEVTSPRMTEKDAQRVISNIGALAFNINEFLEMNELARKRKS